MVKYSSSQLDEIFGALSDPSRRAILERLAHGDSNVGELAAPLKMSGPAVTKHLNVLERAGLLGRTRAGRRFVCKLKPEALSDAAAWIEKHRVFWDTRFDALEAFFEKDARKPKAAGRIKRNRA